MKKVLIGLLALSSLSAFAAREEIRCNIMVESDSLQAEFNETFSNRNIQKSVKECYGKATEIGVAYANRNPKIILNLTDSFSTKSYEISVKNIGNNL